MRKSRNDITAICALTAYVAEMLAINVRHLAHCIEEGAPDTEIQATLANIEELITALREHLSKIKALGRPHTP